LVVLTVISFHVFSVFNLVDVFFDLAFFLNWANFSRLLGLILLLYLHLVPLSVQKLLVRQKHLQLILIELVQEHVGVVGELLVGIEGGELSEFLGVQHCEDLMLLLR